MITTYRPPAACRDQRIFRISVHPSVGIYSDVIVAFRYLFPIYNRNQVKIIPYNFENQKLCRLSRIPNKFMTTKSFLMALFSMGYIGFVQSIVRAYRVNLIMLIFAFELLEHRERMVQHFPVITVLIGNDDIPEWMIDLFSDSDNSRLFNEHSAMHA